MESIQNNNNLTGTVSENISLGLHRADKNVILKVENPIDRNVQDLQSQVSIPLTNRNCEVVELDNQKEMTEEKWEERLNAISSKLNKLKESTYWNIDHLDILIDLWGIPLVHAVKIQKKIDRFALNWTDICDFHKKLVDKSTFKKEDIWGEDILAYQQGENLKKELKKTWNNMQLSNEKLRYAFWDKVSPLTLLLLFQAQKIDIEFMFRGEKIDSNKKLFFLQYICKGYDQNKYNDENYDSKIIINNKLFDCIKEVIQRYKKQPEYTYSSKSNDYIYSRSEKIPVDLNGYPEKLLNCIIDKKNNENIIIGYLKDIIEQISKNDLDDSNAILYAYAKWNTCMNESENIIHTVERFNDILLKDKLMEEAEFLCETASHPFFLGYLDKKYLEKIFLTFQENPVYSAQIKKLAKTMGESSNYSLNTRLIALNWGVGKNIFDEKEINAIYATLLDDIFFSKKYPIDIISKIPIVSICSFLSDKILDMSDVCAVINLYKKEDIESRDQIALTVVKNIKKCKCDEKNSLYYDRFLNSKKEPLIYYTDDMRLTALSYVSLENKEREEQLETIFERNSSNVLRKETLKMMRDVQKKSSIALVWLQSLRQSHVDYIDCIRFLNDNDKLIFLQTGYQKKQ